MVCFRPAVPAAPARRLGRRHGRGAPRPGGRLQMSRIVAVDRRPPARALAAGSLAAGALASAAVGALAVGAVAVGALAIGRLAVGRMRIRRLEIDELTVRRLHVLDDRPRR
ncbi:conserved hypothetical protein [Phenylobacterium zucineum HLK1]|uniref:Uncharacterized protein n=2 Tax=Phenylobacterium zucineum TaxID=284016 RepID=B4RGY4_PHEZH|nr:conserved hypothetical protein [Phenylobacterium zucineum HLK1]